MISNLLSTDAYIAEQVNHDRSYDLATFDFRCAFDKVLHTRMLKALSNDGLHHSHFIDSRASSQVGLSVSSKDSDLACVPSGVIKKSVVGPLMLNIFIYPLLKKLAQFLPNGVFAYVDDVKLVIGITEADYAAVKVAILEFFTWAKDNCMPLSTKKCFVMYFRNRNLGHDYSL